MKSWNRYKMEVGRVYEHYNLNHYPQLTNNADEFLKNKLKTIKNLRKHDDKDIVVYSIDVKFFDYIEEEKVYKFIANVNYKFK